MPQLKHKTMDDKIIVGLDIGCYQCVAVPISFSVLVTISTTP
ncbi:MAG: hypothetical protein QNJ64_08380 [Crocosphaera sp.]|nr:hypothetical protein [Crocosphaera sp.]